MRNRIIKNAKRIVIKIGTGVLTNGHRADKIGINDHTVKALVRQIINLRTKNIEVIIITSGAVGIGSRTLGRKPTNIPEQQAAAAIGQIQLMHIYEEAFRSYAESSGEYRVAQLLLTQEVVDNRSQFLNTRNTIMTLLEYGVIPIINENDTVAVEEIRFGDNDNLAAIVAHLAEADLVLNLTTVDGLFHYEGESCMLIDEVDEITSDILALVKSECTQFGTGGMLTKLTAAEKIMARGGAMIIANGIRENIIDRIFEGKKEGTIFFPNEKKLSHKRHWIAYTKSSRGEITVDKGAANALIKKGTSLLPVGIIAVNGKFKAGDMVKVVNENNSEIARGLVNYSAKEVKKIKGKKSSEICNILGEENKGYEEVIHRDNLVLT